MKAKIGKPLSDFRMERSINQYFQGVKWRAVKIKSMSKKSKDTINFYVSFCFNFTQIQSSAYFTICCLPSGVSKSLVDKSSFPGQDLLGVPT